MKKSQFYSLNPQASFTDQLAKWVLSRYGQSPDALSRVLLLLPSRRSIRAMQEAFLRVSSGHALLLPQMEGLADIDEKLILRHAKLSNNRLEHFQSIPTAIDPIERVLALSEMIWNYKALQNESLTRQSQAIELAQQLSAFLDELHREQVPWRAFDDLVPAEYAKQWQQTLEVLSLIKTQWPLYLQVERKVDPWQRRNQILSLLSQSWQETTPEFPIIAAGTTGSIPAVAELLGVISGLPKGAVVLPGVDLDLSAKMANALEESHPQFGMMQLLAKHQIAIKEVEDISLDEIITETTKSAEDSSEPSIKVLRQEWLHQSMLPAWASDEWRKNSFSAQGIAQSTYLVECEDLQQESAAIALLLREALEEPTKTAALITPNREIARRVRSALHYWGIAIDDSAGESLAKTPAAIFLQLLIEAAQQQLSPVALLSLLKHPLLRMGRSAVQVRQLTRELEEAALRGLKPAHWQAVLDKEKIQENPELLSFAQEVGQAIEPLRACFEREELPLETLISEHLKIAESLSLDEEGVPQLLKGEASVALVEFMQQLQVAVTNQPPVITEDYLFQLRALWSGQSFRSAWGRHPRLHILSPMEARLQQYDRVILADLNENGWPTMDEADPWLNRPMRTQLGLPLPERKIGLLAHDFVQLAMGEEVFFTRSAKSGGSVTVPSRFILRMQAVLEIAEGKEAVARWKAHPVQHWLKENHLAAESIPCLPPKPKPPVSWRPRALSVTRIERLMRDPYGIYAQKILKLKMKDPLEQNPSYAEFGNAAHHALEWYLQQNGHAQPHPKAFLMDLAAKAFEPYNYAFLVQALWLPRFSQIADWFLQQEWHQNSLLEKRAEWKFAAPAGDFTLDARIDRVDVREEGLRFIDYKTGSPPTKQDMLLGIANQLLLSAVIVQEGGLGDALQLHPAELLEYWQLKGGLDGGKITPVAVEKESSLEAEIEKAKTGVMELIASFDKEAKSYLALPEWRYRPTYNDYEHLARISEWSSLSD